MNSVMIEILKFVQYNHIFLLLIFVYCLYTDLHLGVLCIFLSSLDTILNRLYDNSLNIIICGEFNISYL